MGKKKKPTDHDKKQAARRRQQKAEYERRITDAANDLKAHRPAAYSREELAVRRKAKKSLRFFLETMFPEAFPLAWGPAHLRLIDQIERACLVGLLFALAMPRGSGKTTIITRALIFCLLNGYHSFIVLICATDRAAAEQMAGIVTELTTNPQLGRYYRTELLAIRKCGKRGAAYQRWGDEPTGVELYSDRVCLGHVPIARNVWGAVLRCVSLTSSFRGMQFTTIDGEVRRPSLLLFDDPQTKESAANPNQVAKRRSIIEGDCLNLAGPVRRVSALAAMTVIYSNDLADQMLDRQISPEWQGERVAMLESLPEFEEPWEEYASLRADDLRDGGDGSVATDFYRKNREQMDKGARVSWEERILPGFESAIETAMALKLRDEPAFWAEYQNQPLGDRGGAAYEIDVQKLQRRTIDLEPGRLLPETDRLTAFIDVQKKLLFFVVVGWGEKRGLVVRYGSFPDQKRPFYSRRDARYTLENTFGEEFDASLYAGLNATIDYLVGREFEHPDGSRLAIEKIAVDAKWGWSTEIVRQVCSESEHRAKLVPYMGKYVGAHSKPWNQLPAVRGEKRGTRVRLIPPPKKGYRCRELRVDVNFWKTLVAERLTCGIGSKSAIVLPLGSHRMFAEHCAAEDPTIALSKTGEEVIEWRANPGKPDNDFFDCLVGNAALASLQGIPLSTEKPKKRRLGKNRAASGGRAKSTGRARTR